MADKKKQYLYNEDIPLTSYARTELKKQMQCIEEDTNEQMSISDLPEEQLSNGEFLDNFGIDSSIIESSVSTHDTTLNTNNEAFVEDLYSSDEEFYAALRKKAEPAANISHILNENQFFESLSINIKRSPAELLLMILKYSIANRLSATGLSNLLKFVNCVCGSDVLPDSRYKINQLCDPAKDITLHAVCPICSKYMGVFDNLSGSRICDNCNTSVDVSNPSNICFFAMIDPSDALREHIEVHDSYYDFVVSERVHETNQITDIYDGQLYRNFVNSLNKNERRAYATVIFNTDGAPVFKSSKCSIWPIYVSLNEIPPQNRFKSVITVGLWCGRQKPEMSVLMEVFTEAMNNLSDAGIVCKIKGEERRIKIYGLLACVDSQARPAMNGSSQYNAHYGCDWCLHEGQYYAGSMRYPFKFPLPRERDHASTVEYAREALRNNSRIFGIVTASPLLNLKKFDIVEGFTPDYLHFYLIGVVQQFTNYLLGYLRQSDIKFINTALKNIRAPHQISRLARSLEDRGYWKAREYENWALYYSIPLITSVSQNNRILKHWALLVDALHICLGSHVTYSQLNQANEMLHKFVQQVEDMDSLAGLTYNVHQLLHVCKSIYNWGPLWTHSTFPFESANHNLLTSIHCSKGIILQIARYENIQRCIQLLEHKLYPNCPADVIEYCQNLRAPLTHKAFKLSDITYIGKEKFIKPDHARKFNISQKAKGYCKIIVDGCVFMNTRKNNVRTCNYFAQLRDGRFVKLIDFIVDNNNEMTICEIIETKANYYSIVIRDVLRFIDEICIETSQIWRTCVFIEIDKKMYIVPLPNQLQY